MNESHFDVAIVGSGIVGATATLALAKQTKLKIAIFDEQKNFPAWNKEQYQPRVSAISLTSKRIFQSLDVWGKIKSKRSNPYLHMHVWDEQGDGEIHFDCRDVAEPVLGYIIEDQVIRESLHERFSDYPDIHFLHPMKLNSLEKQIGKISLYTQDDKIFSANLVIAADGAHSWVREQLVLPLKEYDYGHTAIVTTIKTELPHQATAWQRFISTGPVAFLPLDDPHYCSIVWSTSPNHAEQLMSLSEVEFCQALSNAFDFKLGKVMYCDKRYSFPLRMRHAESYVQDHIALIGDAAHTIHPLAGQGVNLGLLDAVCLAEVITAAIAKNRDFSARYTLRRYERWRKSDNAMMLASVGLLKQLFASEKQVIKSSRNAGLNWINRLHPIKNLLTHYALGNRGGLPVIAQRNNCTKNTLII